MPRARAGTAPPRGKKTYFQGAAPTPQKPAVLARPRSTRAQVLRAYVLSDAYAADVNRINPLGSKGRMVDEFAALLRRLATRDTSCVAPRAFKATLARCKPQFAGSDQHDSQEFLAELLDALHEDVRPDRAAPHMPFKMPAVSDAAKNDGRLGVSPKTRHLEAGRVRRCQR